jgi:hypothetical protein
MTKLPFLLCSKHSTYEFHFKRKLFKIILCMIKILYCSIQQTRKLLLLNHHIYLYGIPQTSVTDYGSDSWKSPCNNKDFSLQVYLQIDPVDQPASYPTCTVCLLGEGSLPRGQGAQNEATYSPTLHWMSSWHYSNHIYLPHSCIILTKH